MATVQKSGCHFGNSGKVDELMNKLNNNISFQTILNYLLQSKNIRTNTDISREFNLNHMMRYDWFSHNWQLNKDKTPFFIKYGYIWFYSGFPARGERYNLMKQTWDAVKGMYI